MDSRFRPPQAERTGITKRMSDSIDKIPEKVYSPSEIEKKWAERWLKEGVFAANPSCGKPPFSMVIPPPNITGTLHMGHALNNTLQDILARHKRLRGYDVLWVPGTDHAGIATQNVVEKKLKEEGLTRHDLGREKFIERVWQWKEESGGAIVNQLKRLGASCDWTKEQFTMSESLSRAVREVFVRLHEENLIYRDERLINWCPRCLTALSDIEVEHEETAGKLYHIRYPLAEGAFLTVATTRPETMLGDTAVAVHPEDERYNRLIGKEILLPLTNRRIPVVGDDAVDREFGTGAVKITPAHDFNDFEMGMRHNLKRIAIFDEKAHVRKDVPDISPEVMDEISGLHAHKAREKVVHILKEKGFLAKSEDHAHAIGRCYRCRTVIEPYLSLQWYVKVRPLADEAAKAVESGKTNIIPKSWENTYFEWMRNIKDWCVSRQIWWGHRIPAWYCERCNAGKWTEVRGEKRFGADAEPIVKRDEVTECPKCGSSEVLRDNDVLDTWFSSALWPFSTLGWPDSKEELLRYYPTSALVTGFDIIFFWVARMMMMGLKFMNDVPFKEVYIHALVRDAEGQKMSKSKGNVIDPLTMMDKYGTDALRFSLAAFAAKGRDIKLSEERIEGYRNFANKIWNLARFTLMNVEANAGMEINEKHLSSADKWILTRLSIHVEAIPEAIDNYSFDLAAGGMYSFVWHELCDWYVEFVKPDLWGDNGEERKKASQAVLLKVLKDSLKLLHPFMPFITEEIYSYLPGSKGFIMKSAYPEEGQRYPEETGRMTAVMNIIKTIRNIRTEMNIPPGSMVEAACFPSGKEALASIKEGEGYIKTLARVKDIIMLERGEKPENSAFSVADAGFAGQTIEVFVPLKGNIDAVSEIKRLSKDMDKISNELASVENRLSNEAFIAKAPFEVIEKEKKRVSELIEKKAKLDSAIERMKNIL